MYVGMQCSRIGAIVSVTESRRLMEGAMTRSQIPATMLLSDDETEGLKVWSWWRRGRVDLHQKHGLAVLVALSWSGYTKNKNRAQELLPRAH